MTGQAAATPNLTGWEHDSTYETGSADGVWTSAYAYGWRVSRFAIEKGTNATRGEEQDGAFDGTLRMA
jgi:hypothetical protein